MAAITLLPALLLLNLPLALQAQLNDWLWPHSSGSKLEAYEFDAWTAQVSSNLTELQQQQVAHNVHWLETPKSRLQLQRLQRLLGDAPANPFKLKLWLSCYWELRRARRFENNLELLQHFALTLMRLHQQGTWNAQLQNMWQTLPRVWRELLLSRWVCVQHAREFIYLGSASQHQLGASNCSRWQVQHVGGQSPWLRLTNACRSDEHRFVNMLQQHGQTFLLLRQPSQVASSSYCLRTATSAYFAERQQTTSDCYWLLNNCSELPELLAGNKTKPKE